MSNLLKSQPLKLSSIANLILIYDFSGSCSALSSAPVAAATGSSVDSRAPSAINQSRRTSVPSSSSGSGLRVNLPPTNSNPPSIIKNCL